MKERSRWSSNSILSSILTAVIVLGSCSAKADVQSVCSFKSYSVAEVTPAFEAGSGISDEYKSERLKLVHSNQITDKKFGSVNREFLKFKTLQVDGLLNVLSNGSPDNLKFLPENADIQLVFWENERPFFYSDFWFPKYIDSFFMPPSETERIFDSPWIKIRLNSTTCKLTVLTLWNVRQFIADEANVSGLSPVKNGIITAQNDTERDLPREYNQEVIGVRYYTSKVGGPKERVALIKKIKSGQSERIETAKAHLPSELFWLFSSINTHVGHTDTGTFGNLLVKKMDEITSRASNALAADSRVITREFMQSTAKLIAVNDVIALAKFVEKKNLN
jgi:hypothetical protein